MNLSNAEQSVYNEIIQGKSNREIGETLFVTEKTIKFHLTNIYRKLNVKSRAELIAYQHKNGGDMKDLPMSNEQEIEVSINSKKSLSAVNKDSVEFVNEQFNVKASIETLHNNMTEISKQGFTANNVNAACNCARAINETINTAINAAKFIGSIR